MPLNSKLLESYGSVYTNLAESSALRTAKEKVLQLFQSKAPNGVLDVDGEKFTTDTVKNALDSLGDEDTVNDFVKFLGLDGEEMALAEEAEPTMSPEAVADSVRKHIEGGVSRIVINSHYGNAELPVTEMWAKDGTLTISVETPDTNTL